MLILPKYMIIIVSMANQKQMSVPSHAKYGRHVCVCVCITLDAMINYSFINIIVRYEICIHKSHILLMHAFACIRFIIDECLHLRQVN